MADHLGSVDVIGRQVSRRAVAPVVALDAHWPAARTGWAAGMNAATGLYAGLLVGAEHVVVFAQRLAVEDPLVKGLFGNEGAAVVGGYPG